VNGWQRLGVVIATIVAVPTWLLATDQYDSAYVAYTVPSELRNLSGQEWVDKVYWAANANETELKRCITQTVRVRQYGDPAEVFISCDKDWWDAASEAFGWALIPYLLVFGIGYTFAWVRRGFRQAA
jgi:hypothetical protein